MAQVALFSMIKWLPFRLTQTNGVLKADQPSTYTTGDTLKIALEYDSETRHYNVSWYKIHNGVVTPLYTEIAPPITYPLLLDTSIYSMNAKVSNAYICSDYLGSSATYTPTPIGPTPTNTPTPSGNGPGASGQRGSGGKGSGGQGSAGAGANSPMSPSPTKPPVLPAPTAVRKTNSGIGPLTGGTTTVTLYVGSLYEEDISNPNNPSPPYTSFYYLGGSSGTVVGMRRANYASGNGQYRIVGDHLGSTTIIVDTSNPPNVVQRQYYKPYGEIALQTYGGGYSSSLTSRGYTGQRLDQASGLMYYGARFYDAVLSNFLTADTIAPAQADPRSRERYAYALNNPIYYLDPSGHDPCKTSGDSQCKHDEEVQTLKSYGINVDEKCGGNEGGAPNIVSGCMTFSADDLSQIIDAIEKMMSAGGWSIADFKTAMGITDKQQLTLENRTLFGGGGWTDPTGNRIVLDMGSFTGLTGLDVSRTMVHELAHVWDFKSGNYDPIGNTGGNLAQGMARKVKLEDDYMPSTFARDNLDAGATGEVWADAVAYYVYPPSPTEYHNDKWPTSPSGRENPLWLYVRNQFARYGPGGPKTPEQ
jgi:RHS repeat-associated protein